MGFVLAGCCKGEPRPSEATVASGEQGSVAGAPVEEHPSARPLVSSVPSTKVENMDVAALQACCESLRDESTRTRAPQNVWLMGAANYCNAGLSNLRAPGQLQAMVVGIRGALRNSPIPEACKKIGVFDAPPGIK